MDPAFAQRKFRQFSIRGIIFQHQYMNVTLHEGPDNYTIPGVRTLNRVNDPGRRVESAEWRVLREAGGRSHARGRMKFETSSKLEVQILSARIRVFRNLELLRISYFGLRVSVRRASPVLSSPKWLSSAKFCAKNRRSSLRRRRRHRATRGPESLGRRGRQFC